MLKKRRAALERDERTEAARDAAKRDALRALRLKTVTVSYTHLTLPTLLLV